MREARVLLWFDAIRHDLRHALRRLHRSPGFAFFAVVSLGLGIGATTAIYSVVRAVVGPPSGVRGMDTILNVYRTPGGGFPRRALPYGDFLDFERRQTSFDQLMAWAFTRQMYSANGTAETGYGEFVNGRYFDLLGVVPRSAGRSRCPTTRPAPHPSW